MKLPNRVNKFANTIMLLVLMMVMGLILSACGANATPTSPAAVATATVTAAAPTTTTAPQPTSTAITLPTATPLPVTATAAPAATVASTPTRTVAPATTGTQSNVTAPTTQATRPTTSNVNRVLYVEAGNLLALDISTGQKQELVKAGVQPVVGYPDWSKAASTVVVAMQPKVKGATIFQLNPDGSNLKKLISNQPEGSSDENPIFSPNGKLIAFTRIYDTNKDGKFDENDRQKEIWLVEANGQNARKLADGYQPAFAPDNLRVAYVTNGEIKPDYNFLSDNSIKIVNVQGQNEWEAISTKKMPADLTRYDYPFGPGTVFLQHPIFLDGGRTLAFGGAGHSGIIATINTTNGGDFKPWAAVYEGGVGRVFANPAGGTKILYEGLPPSGLKQFTVVDTNQQPNLAKTLGKTFGEPKTNMSAFAPAWSADGSKIAFVQGKNRDGATSNPALMLATLKADGSWEQKELLKGNITALVWEK